jgi:DNA-binding NarL/FixJ family response regulator
MTTHLIGSNEVLFHMLARSLTNRGSPPPVCWPARAWLEPSPGGAPHPLVAGPADAVLVDCSGTGGDPRRLLDRLHPRLATLRWMVLSDTLDPGLVSYAARLGAVGCLRMPAPAEVVGAAAALVGAGGQCFPAPTRGVPGGPV